MTIIFLVLTFICATYVAFYIYQMAVIDAKSRGIKRPKMWALLATGGQNGGGILLYLIKRRKYRSTMSKQDQTLMERMKKRIGIGLLMLVISSIGMLISIIFY